MSATIRNAEEIVAAVWDYCIPRAITFKFIRNKPLLLFRNAKSADRGSSGKFVTIYPTDEGELKDILVELGARLNGQDGPYILSDLRWDSGPLYVRYGGLAPRSLVAANGELEPAIEDPDGNLVPDRRLPTFALPAWVSMPEFLKPHFATRGSATFDNIPYQIQGAIHFSNSGGVYRAVDQRSGEQVVLKEARPHTAFSNDGTDSVDRLGREREILQQLEGLAVVPAFRDYFTVGEHHYLVQDFVEGSTLNAMFVARYPLFHQDDDPAQLMEYTSWAVGMCERVERAAAAVHDRNVIIGDINASNIIVRPDGEVALIDWEVAQFCNDAQRPSLATPDFLTRADLEGIDIDRHALALLRIFLFMPLTAILRLDMRKVEQYADEIIKIFPCSPEFVFEAARVIVGPVSEADGSGRSQNERPESFLRSASWPDLRDSMAGAIVASATPARHDRLFPGDPDQFEPGGGINLSYGAAGVLYALDKVGAGRYPQFEDWLVERALGERGIAPLGLYDGLHGVAFVLDQLERRNEALKVLQICMDRLDETLSDRRSNLRSGLAGIGLNLAYFAKATGDAALKDAAQKIVELVANRLGDETAVGEISGGEEPYSGLLRGSSGPALLFMRWFEETEDRSFLEFARTALQQDLRRCVMSPTGGLYVDEGWRLMPYVADGSVGIGMAINDYLVHDPDAELTTQAAAIAEVARSRFFIFSGLFSGRAGMILYLTHQGDSSQTTPAVANHVRDLGWHALFYEDNLAFAGDQLLRLSMDLATGTSGVLLALGAALHDRSVHLPFVGSNLADRSTSIA